MKDTNTSNKSEQRSKEAAPSGDGANKGPKRTRVLTAEFETSAPDVRACPEGDIPEVALAGRSNVGKSSLLNALTHQRGLATVSRNPGRTRLLNYFKVRIAHGEHKMHLRIVDLPGYGFARASRSIREGFAPMIGEYLTQRVALRALLVLMDARRGPTDLDLEMLEFTTEQNLPCLLCVTKVDKLSASQRGLLGQKFAKELGISPRAIALTSAQTGLGLQGDGKKHDLVSTLGQWVLRWNSAAAPSEANTEGEHSGEGEAAAESDHQRDDGSAP